MIFFFSSIESEIDHARSLRNLSSSTLVSWAGSLIFDWNFVCLQNSQIGTTGHSSCGGAQAQGGIQAPHGGGIHPHCGGLYQVQGGGIPHCGGYPAGGYQAHGGGIQAPH